MEANSQQLNQPLLLGDSRHTSRLNPSEHNQGNFGIEALTHPPDIITEEHREEAEGFPLFTFAAHLKNEMKLVKTLQNRFVAEQEHAVLHTCIANEDEHILCVLKSGIISVLNTRTLEKISAIQTEVRKFLNLRMCSMC